MVRKRAKKFRLAAPPGRASPKRKFRRELSAGAIIFRNFEDKREYLVLHYIPPETTEKESPNQEKAKKQKFKESWGFPRGQVEKSENLEEAARREIREETGLDALDFIPGFREKIHYFFIYEDTLISKDLIYFLAKAPENAKVTISREHARYEWLNYEEAISRLTHKNDREVLEKAEIYLNGSS